MSFRKGSRRYKAKLDALKEQYGRKKSRVNVHLPKYLHEEWKLRGYRDEGIYLSDLVSVALHFALFGQQKFANPIDNLEDAFDVYEESVLSDRDLAAHVLVEIGKRFGFDVEIKNLSRWKSGVG